ncbi:PQQ-binding-like beta-propeller repeat protein [Natrinema caseinilyticum]|uniref:outer membrane protein assembly factor BamB family protein n=1 Tax=Natrinema caseinilyticum TaxID=2961570 RepID=UPI0020C347ED|nr:PQQ-binding-like beta-propeller repeat protein [Natrinema caseinilyticum]
MNEFRRRTVLSTAVALAAGGSLGSVGADDDGGGELLEEPAGWSSHGGNPANGRYVPSEDGIARPDTVAWTYDEYRWHGSTAVVDGTVYVRPGVETTGVHALDADDGSVKWRNDEVPAEGTPAIAGETVYVGGDQLMALDAADGSIRWTREFDYEPLEDENEWDVFPVADPTIRYGRVYVVVDGTIYAFDPTDGSTDWKCEAVDVDMSGHYEDESDIETFHFETLPIPVANGSVYASTEDGKAVVAFDAMTGEKRWASDTTYSWRVAGHLTANDTAVFGGSFGAEESVMIDAETGERDILQGHFLDATKGDIRVNSGDARIFVSDFGDDPVDQSWTSPYFKATNLVVGGGNIAIVGNTLVFTLDAMYEGEKSAVGFDLDDGSEKWVIWNSDELHVNPIEAVSADTIYDYNHDDRLRALRATNEDEDSNGSEEKDSNGSEDGSEESEDERDSDGDDNGSGGSESQRDDEGNGDAEDGRQDESKSGGSDEPGRGRETDESGTETRENTNVSGSTTGEGDTESSRGEGGDSETTEDSTSGFTPIAGLTAGALTLEGLCRKADGESDGTDQE